jgi:L-ribulose-5-phosphate 3-epimerase UlaE
VAWFHLLEKRSLHIIRIAHFASLFIDVARRDEVRFAAEQGRDDNITAVHGRDKLDIVEQEHRFRDIRLGNGDVCLNGTAGVFLTSNANR